MSDFESRARKAAESVRRQIVESDADHETGIRRAQRSPARVALPAAVAAAVLISAVAVGLPRVGGGGTASGGGNVAMALTGALQPFGTCDNVLEHFKNQAPEYLLERARHGRGFAEDGVVPVTATRQSSRSGADAGAATEAGSQPTHSTTNVHEAGVDEPDIVKTDGNRIVAVVQERVHLVGFDGGKMALRKILPDTMVRDVFLAGDRLLVFGSRAARSSGSGWRWADQQAVLTMYDISSLSDPKLVA